VLAIERKNRILTILREDKHVVVSELAKNFEVSEETIRRDLDKLEKEGYVSKTYGGAVICEGKEAELPYVIRKKANVAAKQKIAELASEMVVDGDSIILDASSTAVFIAQKIKTKKDISVITNSIEVLMELADVSGWKVYCTGGALKGGIGAILGGDAEEYISRFHVDKAFISCKGVDMKNGFTDSNDSHAAVKRKMIRAASQVFFAVDSSKFNRLSFTSLCNFSGIDAIITEKQPNADWLKVFSDNNLECLYPQGDKNE